VTVGGGILISGVAKEFSTVRALTSFRMVQLFILPAFHLVIR